MSLIVRAMQRLEECDAILAKPADQLEDSGAAHERAHAAILPVASALATTYRLSPAVAPHLLYLMIAGIIGTWIGHEIEADSGESSPDGIDAARTERALEEREGTLRWLDRVVACVTDPEMIARGA